MFLSGFPAISLAQPICYDNSFHKYFQMSPLQASLCRHWQSNYFLFLLFLYFLRLAWNRDCIQSISLPPLADKKYKHAFCVPHSCPPLITKAMLSTNMIKKKKMLPYNDLRQCSGQESWTQQINENEIQQIRNMGSERYSSVMVKSFGSELGKGVRSHLHHLLSLPSEKS